MPLRSGVVGVSSRCSPRTSEEAPWQPSQYDQLPSSDVAAVGPPVPGRGTVRAAHRTAAVRAVPEPGRAVAERLRRAGDGPPGPGRPRPVAVSAAASSSVAHPPEPAPPSHVAPRSLCRSGSSRLTYLMTRRAPMLARRTGQTSCARQFAGNVQNNQQTESIWRRSRSSGTATRQRDQDEALRAGTPSLGQRRKPSSRVPASFGRYCTITPGRSHGGRGDVSWWYRAAAEAWAGRCGHDAGQAAVNTAQARLCRRGSSLQSLRAAAVVDLRRFRRA